jgi:hypothetical protein
MSEGKKKPDFERWIGQVKHFLVHHKVIKPDVNLCPKSWKMYYDEGLSATKAIKEDTGITVSYEAITTYTNGTKTKQN